jgi:hypothetical protein
LFPFHVVNVSGVLAFFFLEQVFPSDHVLFLFILIFLSGFLYLLACLFERSHEARSCVQIQQARRYGYWLVGHGARKGKSNCFKITANGKNERMECGWDPSRVLRRRRNLNSGDESNGQDEQAKSRNDCIIEKEFLGGLTAYLGCGLLLGL